MMKRTRLVTVAVTLAALATTGTASAATSGSAPTVAKPGAAAKADGKSKPGQEAELAAIAAKLGVSTDRLNAALMAAKRSLAGSAHVTPDRFAAAVAAKLGLPVARARAALMPLLLQPGRPRPGDDKRDHKSRKDGTGKGTGDPRNSPFTSDAAAARLAAALGVSRAKAKAVLIAVVSAPDGIAPTSKAFHDLAKSLGVTAGQLMTALGNLKQSLAQN